MSMRPPVWLHSPAWPCCGVAALITDGMQLCELLVKIQDEALGVPLQNLSR